MGADGYTLAKKDAAFRTFPTGRRSKGGPVNKKPPKKRSGQVHETGDASHFNQPTAPTVFAKTGAASNLARVAFTTSRELEFFTESELTTQIGYRKGLWPQETHSWTAF